MAPTETDGDRRWRRGKTGPTSVHGDGALEAKDGLLVERTFVTQRLSFKHPVQMRRDILEGKCAGGSGGAFHEVVGMLAR